MAPLSAHTCPWKYDKLFGLLMLVRIDTTNRISQPPRYAQIAFPAVEIDKEEFEERPSMKEEP